MKPVGVLALQGGYAAHTRCLDAIQRDWVLVRTPDDLARCSGLILPGGESTTHLKLIKRFNMWTPLDDFVQSGRPVLATCAGLILSAKKVIGRPQDSFGWLDIDVNRNAWGRQVHSFETELNDSNAPQVLRSPPFKLLFIRAPRIERTGDHVEVLVRYEGEAVAVRQERFLGLSFHPELKNDARFHDMAFGDASDS